MNGWEAKHSVMVLAILTCPLVVAIAIGLIRGYSIEVRFWRPGQDPKTVRLTRDKGDHDA